MRSPFVLAAILALSACTTPDPYHPATLRNGWMGIGYLDEALPDGGYRIRVALTGTPEAAHAMWDRRAGEVCQGRVHRKNIYSASRPPLVMGPRDAARGNLLVLEGYAYCEGGAVAVTPAGRSTGVRA